MLKNKYYTDFLKDKLFLQWQFTPDEELNEYWSNFIKQNPLLEEEMQKAIRYLKTTGLNKSILTKEEKDQLLCNIINSNSERLYKKRVKQILIAVSSAAAIIVFALGLNAYLSSHKTTNIISNRGGIVGNQLVGKDIQLISGDQSIFFDKNVDITVSNDGKVHLIDDSIGSKSDLLINSKQSINRLIVPYGKRTTVILADGSKVWINSGSVLEFPSHFSGVERKIDLKSGEIYVDVTHDKNRRFIVNTSDISVKVYGTQFNLTAYSEMPQSVVLVKGSVSLSTTNGIEAFLKPREQGVYLTNGKFKTSIVDVNKYIGWKDGYLSFDDAPITEVLKQVGRYYNVNFDYSKMLNLDKLTCTGRILLSDNVDNVMRTIAILSQTKYDKIGNDIYITLTNN